MSSQKIIIDIQSLLRNPAVANENQVKSVANRYIEACETANERLQEAMLHLNGGLRFEAQRRIKEAPELIKEVETLIRFPELKDWISLAERVGIQIPQVDFKAADKLNELYYIPKEHVKLAAEFRDLNARAAPLDQRIRKLEQMCKAEPDNQLWRECLEQHRASK